MTSLSDLSSLKNTIPTPPTYQQRPPLRPRPTRERARNAIPVLPQSRPLQPREHIMIRMTRRAGMERKRKILIDTSSRAFQVLRIPPIALSHFFSATFPPLISLTCVRPGKHSIKKDDFLTTIVQVPPKQHIPIAPFDSRTQSEAFTVSLEGLKGVRFYQLLDLTSTTSDFRPQMTPVEYSCPRPRIHTGTRRPEEASAYQSCGSSPTCQS